MKVIEPKGWDLRVIIKCLGTAFTLKNAMIGRAY